MANAFGWIGAWLSRKKEEVVPPPSGINSITPSAKQLAIYREALKHEGWEEHKNRTAIAAFIGKSGIKLDPVTLPWCAAFANGCCAAVGVKGTGSAMARSFLDLPRTFYPKEGDFVIFWRVAPKAATGHVGFFVRFSADKTKVLCYAGNQSNSVGFAWQDVKTILGYTRIE